MRNKKLEEEIAQKIDKYNQAVSSLYKSCLEEYGSGILDFIDWKDNLHSEIRGGKLMFDVPKYYKWLDENELFDYYIEKIKIKTI